MDMPQADHVFTPLTTWITPEVFHLLLPLPTVLPMCAAAACLAGSRRTRFQSMIAMSTLAALVIVALVMVIAADIYGPAVVHIGGWASPVGISLVADRLGTLMLLISAVVLSAVMTFALGQGIGEASKEQPVSIFLPTYLALTAGVNNAFLAGDVFNLFVGFEILLAASYVLLTIGGNSGRIRAGVSYVIVSMVSSAIFLFAIALTYAATGTLSLAHIAVRMRDVPTATAVTIFSIFVVAFGVKAAIFPLSSWLPDSYPTAPAPVTAVFAGILTKVGVYALIRFHTLVFPGGHLDTVLMWSGLLTMLVGIFGAIAQSDIKRLLSFTLISHIGYLVFAISLSTPAGLSGAIYYVMHHILVQTTLFLIVGIIERQAGSSSLRRLGSLASRYPLLTIAFFIPALNVSGIPPLSGALGKIAIVQAALQSPTSLQWLAIASTAVTSLLTLYVIVRVWTKAFWRPRADSPEGHLSSARPEMLVEENQDVHIDHRVGVGKVPVSMFIPVAGLIAASSLMTITAGPLFGVTDRAAEQLFNADTYISAVLGEGSGK